MNARPAILCLLGGFEVETKEAVVIRGTVEQSTGNLPPGILGRAFAGRQLFHVGRTLVLSGGVRAPEEAWRCGRGEQARMTSAIADTVNVCCCDR
jgi:hypothetical protein